MTAASAAEGDRELHPAALAISRKQRNQRPLEIVQRPQRGRLAEHVVPDPRVRPVQGAQLVDPVGVVEKAAVHDPVRAARQAVLESERETGDDHPFP